jgi:hypothetical protein
VLTDATESEHNDALDFGFAKWFAKRTTNKLTRDNAQPDDTGDETDLDEVTIVVEDERLEREDDCEGASLEVRLCLHK